MRCETTLNSLCRELERNCGDELAAAQAVGVSLAFVNQWRKDDKQVHERLVEASRVGAQGLVSAAIQRAVHGVDKGVYHKGALVATEKQYSDALLVKLMEAKLPEFAKGGDGTGVHVSVNVANVMPRATSYEQWLEMKKQTLAKPVDALPAPDDVSEEAKAAAWIMSPPLDAEYVEITPEPAFAGIEL
jgi:hypothetical protein